MINVKIECPCGQHYEFEVEPVNGRMASMVACPVCGTDGTETANTIIAGKLSSVRPPVHIPKVPLAAALPETNQESSVSWKLSFICPVFRYFSAKLAVG